MTYNISRAIGSFVGALVGWHFNRTSRQTSVQACVFEAINVTYDWSKFAGANGRPLSGCTF